MRRFSTQILMYEEYIPVFRAEPPIARLTLANFGRSLNNKLVIKFDNNYLIFFHFDRLKSFPILEKTVFWLFLSKEGIDFP
jgi:hypothetical protein